MNAINNIKTFSSLDDLLNGVKYLIKDEYREYFKKTAFNP